MLGWLMIDGCKVGCTRIVLQSGELELAALTYMQSRFTRLFDQAPLEPRYHQPMLPGGPPSFNLPLRMVCRNRTTALNLLTGMGGSNTTVTCSAPHLLRIMLGPVPGDLAHYATLILGYLSGNGSVSVGAHGKAAWFKLLSSGSLHIQICATCWGTCCRRMLMHVLMVAKGERVRVFVAKLSNPGETHHIYRTHTNRSLH